MFLPHPEDLAPEIIQQYRKLAGLESEDFEQEYVRFVAIPLPPTPVGGLLYDPYAYASATFDNQFERDFEGGDYQCISMVPTNQGPAFYMVAKIGFLLNMTKCYELERYHLSVKRSAFCARIELDIRTPRKEQNALVEGYADNVLLRSMAFVGRSCHGGSHLIVPGAPYLTALLQHTSAPGHSLFFKENVSDRRVAARYGQPWLDEIGTLFPANWDRNTAIDMIVSEGFVGNWKESLSLSDITLFEYRDCIGKWAQPCLRRLTRNILTPLGEHNGSLSFYSRARRDFEKADSANSTSQVRHSLAESMSANFG